MQTPQVVLLAGLLAAVIGRLTVQAHASDEKESGLGLEPGTQRLQNDDIGVILWGPDTAPTLSIGKSDVWDRRLPPTEKPVLTLAEMSRMAQEGDPAILDGAAYYTGYNSYDFPCPKPVGQLILQLPFVGADGTLSLEEGEAETTLIAANGDKKLTLRVFVSSLRNLIVIRGHARDLEPGDMSIRLWRHRDTILPGGELHPTIGGKTSPEDFERLPPPRAGHGEDCAWVAQDFPGERTFPESFTSVLACRLADGEVEVEAVEDQVGLGTPMVTEKEGRLSHAIYKRFTPINDASGAAVTITPRKLDGSFTLFATVVTTQDDASPLTGAEDLLNNAVSMGADVLWEEHTKQLTDYAERPRARAWASDDSIKMDTPWGGVPYRVRPTGYYGDVPLCSVDSTKFCYQDSGRWHADFHFNEVDATRLCMQRQFDLLDPYYGMIHTMLPMAQANAREVYDCAGAMYPLVHYPLKADTVIHTHVTWEQSVEISALLARPFWLRFLYTWDMDFLRDRAYPVLREGARFYTDFLKLEEDGLYHVFPTVSPEHRGITRDLEFNKDSQSGITLIRYHLRAASQAARLLDIDSDEAVRWRDIAGHMPAYPTVDTEKGPIYIDVAGAQPMEYNIAVPLTAVFWGDDIGLDSPPEQLELMKRTLEVIDVWKPHQGYLKTVRKRLGIYEPGDGIAMENLLQSHTGVIRVFPAVPEDFEGGFENLGAQGAFVVGAGRGKEGVRNVTISSLAGNPCVLANPWPGAAVKVTCIQTGKESHASEEAGLLRFDTRPEQTLLVEPQESP
jgi:Glycosyl hydrolase family 95 catalytic domain/Glycoside hydrolase family 95, C-terminal domain